MRHVRLNLSGHNNPALAAAGFVWPGCLQVDLTDPELPVKLSRFLGEYIDSGDRVTLVLPGLSALTALVVSIVLGLCGQLPSIQTLVRNEAGEFVPGPIQDLGRLRSEVARRSRPGLIVL